MKQIDDTNSPSRVRSRTAVASLGLWHARSTSRQVSRRRRSRGRVRMGLSGPPFLAPLAKGIQTVVIDLISGADALVALAEPAPLPIFY